VTVASFGFIAVLLQQKFGGWLSDISPPGLA
jgi:hypothetical protein